MCVYRENVYIFIYENKYQRNEKIMYEKIKTENCMRIFFSKDFFFLPVNCWVQQKKLSIFKLRANIFEQTEIERIMKNKTNEKCVDVIFYFKHIYYVKINVNGNSSNFIRWIKLCECIKYASIIFTRLENSIEYLGDVPVQQMHKHT